MARRGGIVRGDEDSDESMPWLEPAEVDDRRHVELPRSRLWLWVVVLGGLLVVVVALVYAEIAKPRDETPVYAENGEVPLIRAPDAPFKVRPANPGGMDLEGLNQTAHEAAGGIDPGGELNFDALPEEPVDRSVLAAGAPPPAPSMLIEEAPAEEKAPAKAPVVEKAPEKPAAKPAAEKAVAKPAEKPAVKTEPKGETKEPVSDGGSFSLQLGAFSTKAKADEAWKRFTGRYSYLADLNKLVIPFERDDEKLYRLRAGGISSRAQADNLCGRLKAAGDQCSVID